MSPSSGRLGNDLKPNLTALITNDLPVNVASDVLYRVSSDVLAHNSEELLALHSAYSSPVLNDLKVRQFTITAHLNRVRELF